MKYKMPYLLASLLSVQLVGCALPVEDSSQGEENGLSNQELSTVKSAVLNGVNDGGDGVVEVRIAGAGGDKCTGAMVGTQMVITASHCFNSWFGNNDAGAKLVPIYLSYARAHDKWLCMGEGPAGPDGKCANYTWFYVSRDMYYEPLPPPRDYAIILSGKAWNNVGINDAVSGLYTGSISGWEYRFHGRGNNSLDDTGEGEMRSFRDYVDAVGNEFFSTTADDYQTVCEGDDGGPYIDRNGWVFGIQSDVAQWEDGCAYPGTLVRASRITVNKMNAINFVRAGAGLNICTQHPKCSECWTCP